MLRSNSFSLESLLKEEGMSVRLLPLSTSEVRLVRLPIVSGSIDNLAWLICRKFSLSNLKMFSSKPLASTLSCTPLPVSTSSCLCSCPAKATSSHIIVLCRACGADVLFLQDQAFGHNIYSPNS